MRFDVVTIFPELFAPFAACSIVGRAVEKGLVTIVVHDLREYTHDRHRSVDDYPYGGGAGMVMKPAPFYEWKDRIDAGEGPRPYVVLLSARGELYTQETARRLAAMPRVALLCGHYKGVDERVTRLSDLELSVGDYVVSGGEIPAMAVMDSVARMLPGVVGNFDSVREDSHFQLSLSYPEYTRPELFRGMRVPGVLVSGDHARIEAWRRKQALAITRSRRPDIAGRQDRHEPEAIVAPRKASAAKHGYGLKESRDSQ